MNPIDLKATNSTPAIRFADDKLSIKGRSIPLSGANFYDQYISWAGQLQSRSLTVEINLEYMNSSSSKKLLQLLKALDNNDAVHSLKINWIYEVGDDEACESGKVFENLMKKAIFKFVKVHG